MLYFTIIIFLLFLSSASASSAAATTSHYVNLFMSWTPILSDGGSLTACQDPTNTSSAVTDCKGGMASADAYIRNYSIATGEAYLGSFLLDRTTAFVQMHPLDWGVNRYVAQTIFNYTHFRSTHAVLTSTRNMSYLQDHSYPFVISNAEVPPSSTWFGIANNAFSDDAGKSSSTSAATQISLISIQPSKQPNSHDSYESVTGALASVARHRLKGHDKACLPIIYFEDSINFDDFVSYVTDPSKVEMLPAAIIDGMNSARPFTKINGTWIGGLSRDSNDINHFRFGVSSDADPYATRDFFTEAQSTIFDLRQLPSEAKDAYYVTKQQELKNESIKASENDPVVGQSDLMPISRTGNIRICMGGECPLGDLWTDAMRWKAGADVAFESSGGIRGLGWAAGGVKVSDLWSSLPFVNQLCTGKISGVNLYKVLNHSVTLASFYSTVTVTGDRLMQVSGLRYTYNTLLPRQNRLVKVEVYNSATSSYEPLERLKIYTFATNSFICTSFDPFPDFFNAADIEGEVAGTLGDEIMQQVVAEYLGSLSSPYDTSLKGRLTNDTSAASAMTSFVQTQETCPVNTFWRPSIQTCQACAAGFVNPNPQDGGSCVAASTEKDVVPLIVGITVPVALLLLLGVFYYFYRKDKMMRENIRDTENAPKVTGELLAIIFTDIQSSTNLWSVAPLSMSYSLEKHNRIINEIIAVNNGFFVKAAGDSYMIAVDCTKKGGCQAAAKIAVDIQREMMKATFPRAINAIYNATTDDDFLDIEDDPNDLEECPEGAVWHGLRVREGLAIGCCEVKFDDLAKTYDYYGSLVNLAARTEASAHGGQILVTPDAIQQIVHQDLDCVVSSFGRFDLKGIPEPVELTQLMPIELHGRRKVIGVGHRIAPTASTGDVLGSGDNEDANNSGSLSGRTGSGLLKVLPSNGESENDDVVSTTGSGYYGGGTGDDSVSCATSAGEQVMPLNAEDFLFITAMLRAVKPNEKSQIVRILENAWRVPRKVRATTLEETLVAIANKISKVKIMMAEQEERKAMRDGRASVVPIISSPTFYNNNNNNSIANSTSNMSMISTTNALGTDPEYRDSSFFKKVNAANSSKLQQNIRRKASASSSPNSTFVINTAPSRQQRTASVASNQNLHHHTNPHHQNQRQSILISSLKSHRRKSVGFSEYQNTVSYNGSRSQSPQQQENPFVFSHHHNTNNYTRRSSKNNFSSRGSLTSNNNDNDNGGAKFMGVPPMFINSDPNNFNLSVVSVDQNPTTNSNNTMPSTMNRNQQQQQHPSSVTTTTTLAAAASSNQSRHFANDWNDLLRSAGSGRTASESNNNNSLGDRIQSRTLEPEELTAIGVGAGGTHSPTSSSLPDSSQPNTRRHDDDEQRQQIQNQRNSSRSAAAANSGAAVSEGNFTDSGQLKNFGGGEVETRNGSNNNNNNSNNTNVNTTTTTLDQDQGQPGERGSLLFSARRPTLTTAVAGSTAEETLPIVVLNQSDNGDTDYDTTNDTAHQSQNNDPENCYNSKSRSEKNNSNNPLKFPDSAMMESIP